MVEPSRRSVLLAGAAFAALAACGRSMPGPTQNGPLSDPAEPAPPVHDRIAALQLRHNASIGVYAADPKTGRTISYQDGVPFAMCSTFKTYAVARVLQKSQRGELRLDVPVYIEPAAVVNNSPVTGPHAGGSLPLSALCEAALQRSDNTAANLLLKAVGGPPAITAFARSIGDEMTRLDRWETELNSAIPGDLRDTSTPRALGGGYQRLLTGDVLGAPERKQLEDWMRGSVTSTRAIRAGLPTGWTAADKSGSGDYGSTNDIGIAYGPEGRQVLLAVMARSQSADPNVENLQSLIAEVTTVTLPWLIGSN